VNPLPRFRLRRPGRSFLVWKALHEGRTLLSRDATVAGRDGTPIDREEAATSYAVSGIRYLLADVEPRQLGGDRLPPDVSWGVGKALLHAAQLHLLRSGRYAARLSDCLLLIGHDVRSDIGRYADRADEPETWFGTLGMLIPWIDDRTRSQWRSLVEGAQYVALARLRGMRRPYRAIFLRTSVSARLARSTVSLALALRDGGGIDTPRLRTAIEELPAFIRPSEGTSWSEVRDLLEREWPHAHPLVGI
jgi:hypothetical protein